MAKILVTGGAGFLGQHIVRALLEGGHSIVVLDDFSNSKRESIPHGNTMDVRVGDVTDIPTVRAVMQGCQHVVHLAGITSASKSLDMPNKTFDVNVGGTQTILEVARELKLAGRVLFASSAAVYGVLDKARVMERDAYGVALGTPYAASKMAAEVQMRLYADVYGVKATSLRIFNAYGPGQNIASPYSGMLGRVVHSIQSGDLLAIYGDGQQTRDFISVLDVAMVVRALLSAPDNVPLPQTMNLGSGLAVSILDMIRQVVALTRVNPRVEYRAARAGDVRLSCADMSVLKGIFPNWKPMALPVGLRTWLG